MECELVLFDFIMNCKYEGYDVIIPWISIPLYIATIIFVALISCLIGYKIKTSKKN